MEKPPTFCMETAGIDFVATSSIKRFIFWRAHLGPVSYVKVQDGRVQHSSTRYSHILSALRGTSYISRALETRCRKERWAEKKGRYVHCAPAPESSWKRLALYGRHIYMTGASSGRFYRQYRLLGRLSPTSRRTGSQVTGGVVIFCIDSRAAQRTFNCPQPTFTWITPK